MNIILQLPYSLRLRGLEAVGSFLDFLLDVAMNSSVPSAPVILAVAGADRDGARLGLLLAQTTNM